MLQPIPPVHVLDRFEPLYDALFALLGSLPSDHWERPTVCPGWTVKDVTLHLLGGDLAILSRERDHYTPASQPISGWNELVTLINDLNAVWVTATRRLSPRVVCDLLRLTAPQVIAYFQSLNLSALGNPVSWAGPNRAPIWLDVAREYTERWHHQQQIREAVGAAGLTDPYYLRPAFETFVHALPRAYRDVAAPAGTCVMLMITGAAGETWCVYRDEQHWQLAVGQPVRADSTVIVPQDIAWRLFTKGLNAHEALPDVTFEGDTRLGQRVLETLAVIA
jgi:uncharacterized protein (TIGR03083 family)